MGPPPRMRPAPPVRPEHAAGLPLWERLAFAVVFAIMVALVVVLTISAARAHERRPGTSAGAAQVTPVCRTPGPPVPVTAVAHARLCSGVIPAGAGHR